MRITVLAGRGVSTRILLNFLADSGFKDVTTIIEQPVSPVSLVRYRTRKLGAITVYGQLAFKFLVEPFLRLESRSRRNAIMEEYKLRADVSDSRFITVSSVNSAAVVDIITIENPDVVIVNGTRIIKKAVLETIKAPIINTHVGITPRYRGVHGGYWALWNGDAKNFGVTLHLVDSGVDTGKPLRQIRLATSPHDNFCTYPLLQQAASLTELRSVLHGMVSSGMNIGILEDISPMLPSQQWFHPTVFQYISGRLRGVK